MRRTLSRAELDRFDGLEPAFASTVRGLIVGLDAWCATYPFGLHLIYGYRSLGEQAELYSTGRTKPGKIVTNAKPGSSAHNYGLAVDLAFLADAAPRAYVADSHPAWMELCVRAEGLGLVSGARWKMRDLGHVEAADWRKRVAK